MPWAAIEAIDDETGDELTHIVPFVEVENNFATREEAIAFGESCEKNAVTDEDNTVIGIHVGHTLTASCICNPRPSESDSYLLIHNASS